MKRYVYFMRTTSISGNGQTFNAMFECVTDEKIKFIKQIEETCAMLNKQYGFSQTTVDFYTLLREEDVAE